jgi:hypothetical protein
MSSLERLYQSVLRISKTLYGEETKNELDVILNDACDEIASLKADNELLRNLSFRDERDSLKADAASAWDKCEERRIENEALKIAHRSHEDSNLKMLAKLKQQAFAEKELRAALVDAVDALEIANKFCGSHTAEDCPDTVAIPINEALTRCKKVLDAPR